MKLCRDIPKGSYEVTYQADCSRANLCQLLWGFVKTWWKGADSVKVILHCFEPPTLFHNGVQVYPPQASDK
jgi:hypothetical protein